MTRDTIDRAVKKGAGLTDEVINFETMVFEGFAPHKVPVIVECLTDNKNRTAADIRRGARAQFAVAAASNARITVTLI